MDKLEARFADYDAHHKTALNKATHSLGIPLIAIALLGLASRVTLFSLPDGPSLDLGVALAALMVAIYLTWHVGLAIGIAVLFAGLYLIGIRIPLT